MQYFRLRDAADVEAPVPGNRVGDLVLVLLHDMATTRSLALGELAVRRRMGELAVQEADCDTLCGNLSTIAASGPRNPEDREILCFYFALGLRGRLEGVIPGRRQRLLRHLRETLDFLASVFGPRCLQHLSLLDPAERQMMWDLVGGTVLALGRELQVPGIDPAGAVSRWAGLFAAAPREDRRMVARALLAHGPPPTGRLALVGILDPLADGDLLPWKDAAPASGLADLLEPSTPPPDAHGEAEPEDEESTLVDVLTPAPASAVAPEAEALAVSGRAVRVRSPGRRLFARLTGWAVAEHVLKAFGSVFLGLRRQGMLRLTRRGLVYDEALWLLGRPVLKRTVAIPLSAMAARLDRRHGMLTLVLGLTAAAGCAFVGGLWTIDGFRTGYWPLLLAAGGVFCVGLVVDLLLYRLSGKLRGRSQLVLDGGEGARIRLDGVRRAEAEALLAALAGPSAFTPAESA